MQEPTDPSPTHPRVRRAVVALIVGGAATLLTRYTSGGSSWAAAVLIGAAVPVTYELALWVARLRGRG